MWPFKCKHPAAALIVEKDSTIEVIDNEFSKITHHLFCRQCRENVDICYAKLRCRPEAFLLLQEGEQ